MKCWKIKCRWVRSIWLNISVRWVRLGNTGGGSTWVCAVESQTRLGTSADQGVGRGCTQRKTDGTTERTARTLYLPCPPMAWRNEEVYYLERLNQRSSEMRHTQTRLKYQTEGLFWHQRNKQHSACWTFNHFPARVLKSWQPGLKLLGMRLESCLWQLRIQKKRALHTFIWRYPNEIVALLSDHSKGKFTIP